MTKKAKKIYDGFQKVKITLEHLKKAKDLSGNLGGIADKFRLLIRMINSDIKGEFKIPIIEKAKIVGAILYVVTPLDAVFDAIPFIGFGDDIAVVTYVFSKLGNLIEQYEVFELKQKKYQKDKNVDFDNLEVVNED